MNPPQWLMVCHRDDGGEVWACMDGSVHINTPELDGGGFVYPPPEAPRDDSARVIGRFLWAFASAGMLAEGTS